jgi:predicted esterase
MAEAGFHHHVVMTDKSGALNVYVQGDIEDAHKDKEQSKCVFLTCHDIGNNHYSFRKFIDNKNFEDIRKRAVFVHVDLPGQEDEAEDFPDDQAFPTIQALGEDLITVLDQLRIKYCIGIGDGAGANIITRFGMMHVTRCLGVIFLHPTANASTVMETFKDKFTKWGVKHVGASAENIAAFRKFGHKLEDTEDKEKALEEYKEKMKHKVNSKNMTKFANAFMKRTDIVPNLKEGLKCDALVVVGTKSSNIHAAEYMHSQMDKTKSSLLKVDNVGNAMDESPEKLANSILLFCKGLGLLTSVNLPGVDRRASQDKLRSTGRQRSVSMEDYDKPNIRRLSVSSKE